MAYSELIKSFDKIRSYMRDFYVYGFKTRTDFDQKSSRSYDDERRRVESWLGEYMYFEQDAAGKRVFLSVDSREVSHNPLYRAFKTCSFTDNDITLHFYILDMLADGESMSGREILDQLTDYLSCFAAPPELDESTVRKKLKEYEKLGLLKSEKKGREVFWSRREDGVSLDSWRDAAAFYSEADPLRVVGSYLLDKPGRTPVPFRFKHHYLTRVLESEVLYELLRAIKEKKLVGLSFFVRQKERHSTVFPLRIYISTRNGRQYLLAHSPETKQLCSFRLDNIKSLRTLETAENPEEYERQYEAARNRLWGTSLGDREHTEHLEMVISIGSGEDFILRRLEREKRCGRIERLDEHRCRFEADVYDAGEMIPWMRTFIGRIQSIYCSNPEVEERFRTDLDTMWALYGGEGNAVQ